MQRDPESNSGGRGKDAMSEGERRGGIGMEE